MQRSYSKVIEENDRRKRANSAPYNQATGEGCVACPRVRVEIKGWVDGDVLWLPKRMVEESELTKAMIRYGSIATMIEKTGLDEVEGGALFAVIAFQKERFKYDFEYWAIKNWQIEQKTSEETIAKGTAGTFQPFELNRGQRNIIKEVYHDLENDRPIRHIVCKARQWGCSTLYSAISGWLQNVLYVGCNSAVVAHTEEPASEIRSMFINAIENYPSFYMDDSEGEGIEDGEKLALVPYKRSTKTITLKERGYRISIGSSVKPDGLRSKNISIAHLSEVAYFEQTRKRTPEALCQSITSGIAVMPNTMIVYESTPNGTGNFFHREYLRAKESKSGFKPIFVAWFEIDVYSLDIDDHKAFIEGMDEKEWLLFDSGATLEAIAWYREKGKEYTDEWRFISEFPSNDSEAFQSSGQLVFSRKDIESLRKYIREPEFRGDIRGRGIEGYEALEDIEFIDEPFGKFKVWAKPCNVEQVANRYLVVVDIGVGLSDGADNSIILVLDRYYMIDGGVPEVVAEWAGHEPKDLVVWRAAQIAKWYNNALLVVEKNSLIPRATDYSEFILDTLVSFYSNLYVEQGNPDQVKESGIKKYGFHTNHSSKLNAITFFKEILRKEGYIEREEEALNEMFTFARTEKGTYEAIEGNRDDRVDTRCIGMLIAYKKMPPAMILEHSNNINNTRKINEASFF